MSVFRSETNAAVEITETVDPAFFQQGDAEREIQRLSRDFGQQARVIAADLPSGGRAVIAVWGAVTLTTLDSPTLDALRRGAPVHSGLLVGVLGDPRASARLGLPVYSLGGGAGFIWSAVYNSSGKGVLRIIAVDPSALNSAPQPQPVVVPAPSPAPPNPAPPEPIVSPSPAPPSPEEAARRERERADHLEKAVAAAKRQLDDAAQFIKEDPQNPKLLDYVDRIAALNAAVGQDDPDDIERKMADLSAALANDKDYQQFASRARQAAERGRGAASQRRDSACPGTARLPRRPRQQEPARAGSRHADAADQADRASARETEPGPTSAADRSNRQRHSRGEAR